jgi:hypothetical protein
VFGIFMQGGGAYGIPFAGLGVRELGEEVVLRVGRSYGWRVGGFGERKGVFVLFFGTRRGGR